MPSPRCRPAWRTTTSPTRTRWSRSGGCASPPRKPWRRRSPPAPRDVRARRRRAGRGRPECGEDVASRDVAEPGRCAGRKAAAAPARRPSPLPPPSAAAAGPAPPPCRSRSQFAGGRRATAPRRPDRVDRGHNSCRAPAAWRGPGVAGLRHGGRRGHGPAGRRGRPAGPGARATAPGSHRSCRRLAAGSRAADPAPLRPGAAPRHRPAQQPGHHRRGLPRRVAGHRHERRRPSRSRSSAACASPNACSPR